MLAQNYATHAETLTLPLQRAQEPRAPYLLPTVTEVAPLTLEEAEIPPELAPAAIYRVHQSDPYEKEVQQAFPEMVEDLRVFEHGLDRYVYRRRMRGEWQREPKPEAYGRERLWGDQETLHKVFEDVGSNALKRWQQSIPSPFALLPVYAPILGAPVYNKYGLEVEKLDDVTSVVLTVFKEPHGVRSRAGVMAWLFKEFASTRAAYGETVLNTMSIACGTALPWMLASKEVEQMGIATTFTPLDTDKRVQRIIPHLADTIKYGGKLQPVINKSAFEPEAMASLKRELQLKNELPDAIESAGSWEYVQHDAPVVLRSWYDLLQPGGRLVSSQIRSDRGFLGGNPHDPSTEVTMGATCWPYIIASTAKQIMRNVHAAGIPLEQVRLYQPDDGVNTVFSIDKPPFSSRYLRAA